ncbi:AraC family transcriptional regulator [Natronospirillum operosum]|uniref:AraC family transcriptional regulator n=1 Tax=Natronospirillum operosum TaxID=2759953 RepID=A0A4Z0WDX8_9GAMM|nr:AraC family transcriptional regulator [Natronospirillum operosum]
MHPDASSSADILGEALHLLRLQGTLYCQAELTQPWGVAVPAMEDLITLQIITAGQAWLEVEGSDPLLLRPGSLTLIPHGTPHRLSSDRSLQCQPLFNLPVEQISDCYERLYHGGGGPVTQVTYGVVRFDHVAGERLISQLPRLLHIDALDTDAASWLQSTLRLIASEAATLKPGGETIITRLADILVIQAIRAWLDSAPEARQGWLAALRDRKIGRALALMHRTPEQEWSIESLARAVGMSRSGFSARFTEMVGEPAMRYLAHWRLQLARQHLMETSAPLSAVIERFGYQSEAAFCRAFKRQFGQTPGQVSRGGTQVESVSEYRYQSAR